MRKYLALFVVVVLALASAAIAADLRSNIMQNYVIGPDTSVSNNDNTTGEIIDKLGYESVTYIIQSGTLADSDVTLTPVLQECAVDNCSDAAATAAGNLIGTIAGATFAATDDNTVKSIGYSGSKRYTRLIITPAANTGAARFNAIAILGHPKTGATQ